MANTSRTSSPVVLSEKWKLISNALLAFPDGSWELVRVNRKEIGCKEEDVLLECMHLQKQPSQKVDYSVVMLEGAIAYYPPKVFSIEDESYGDIRFSISYINTEKSSLNRSMTVNRKFFKFFTQVFAKDHPLDPRIPKKIHTIRGPILFTKICQRAKKNTEDTNEVYETELFSLDDGDPIWIMGLTNNFNEKGTTVESWKPKSSSNEGCRIL